MKKISNQNGFTLIEICIALIIIGVITVTLIQSYQIYQAKQKLIIQDLRFTDAEQALKDFAELNGRLPCAAPRNIPSTDPAFGREVNCATAAVPNQTVRVPGAAAGSSVRIGLFPARTLGLGDSYMLDAYGNMFLYAVTENSTNTATYSDGGGEIDVLDGTDTSLLTATMLAHYVLLSNGQNGNGAYSYAGTLIEACNTNLDEGENCDDDATFKINQLSEVANNNHYDDEVRYKNKLNIDNDDNEDISCRKIQTTGSTCPPGWNSTEEDYVALLPHSYSGQDSGGMSANAHANNPHVVISEPTYINQDPETGEFYKTNFETSNTIFGNDIATSQVTGQPVVTCEMPSTGECKNFKEEITTSGNLGGDFSPGLDEAESLCPEGTFLTGVYENQYEYTTGGDEENHNLNTAWSITCSR